MKSNALVVAALLVAATPAPAALLTPSSLNGNTYTDYSADGLLSLDINLNNLAPLNFNVSFNAGEIAAGSVTFNAIIKNFAPTGIPDLLFDFGGLSVIAGTVQSDWQDSLAGKWSVSQHGGTFLTGNGSAPNEFFGLLVGDPIKPLDPPAVPLADWTINTRGLNADSSYALRVVAVPEPDQLALLGVGLAMLFAMGRRRRA
jgi:hypothetical protein